MRNALATLIIMLTVGWIASDYDFEHPNAVDYAAIQALDDWRRTTRGWERSQAWRLDNKPRELNTAVNRMHPGLFASFVGLASFGFLLAGAKSTDFLESQVSCSTSN